MRLRPDPGYLEHAPDGAPDYEEAERPPPRLGGKDIAVEHRPARLVAEPVTTVSRAPHVDHLMADLNTILLSQTAKLRDRALSEQEGLDAADIAVLSKLVDGVVRLTKLQIEREKHDRPEQLSEDELRAALEEQLRLLES